MSDNTCWNKLSNWWVQLEIYSHGHNYIGYSKIKQIHFEMWMWDWVNIVLRFKVNLLTYTMSHNNSPSHKCLISIFKVLYTTEDCRCIFHHLCHALFRFQGESLILCYMQETKFIVQRLKVKTHETFLITYYELVISLYIWMVHYKQLVFWYIHVIYDYAN